MLTRFYNAAKYSCDSEMCLSSIANLGEGKEKGEKLSKKDEEKKTAELADRSPRDSVRFL